MGIALSTAHDVFPGSPDGVMKYERTRVENSEHRMDSSRTFLRVQIENKLSKWQVRGGSNPYLRRWRPVLYQLSYWPLPKEPAHQEDRHLETYFVSRCMVCVRQKRQYFFNSSRSVVRFLFLVDV